MTMCPRTMSHYLPGLHSTPAPMESRPPRSRSSAPLFFAGLALIVAVGGVLLIPKLVEDARRERDLALLEVAAGRPHHEPPLPPEMQGLPTSTGNSAHDVPPDQDSVFALRSLLQRSRRALAADLGREPDGAQDRPEFSGVVYEHLTVKGIRDVELTVGFVEELSRVVVARIPFPSRAAAEAYRHELVDAMRGGVASEMPDCDGISTLCRSGEVDYGAEVMDREGGVAVQVLFGIR